jgi:small subunit ribosomal protein S17
MPKRVLSGTVVSDKPDKTVVVRVERRVKHPLYGKIIRLSKKYHAHDQDNAYRAGEQVRIQECAPISKLKTWSVIDRIGAAKAAPIEIVETATVEAEAAADAAMAEKPSKKPAVAEAVEADTAPAEAEVAETEAKEAKPSKKAPAKEKAPAKKAPAKKAPAKKAPAKKAKAKDVAAADIGAKPKGKKAKS